MSRFLPITIPHDFGRCGSLSDVRTFSDQLEFLPLYASYGQSILAGMSPEPRLAYYRLGLIADLGGYVPVGYLTIL